MAGIFKINNNEIIDSSGKLTSAVFPAGHIISFAEGNLSPTSPVSISTSDYHFTSLSCDLVTTSTSNKIVVQYFLPDIHNNAAGGASVHCGLYYNTGTGAFDNSTAQKLGSKKFIGTYNGYEDGNVSSALFHINILLVASVPTVNTLRLYPLLLGVNAGVDLFDNANGSDNDVASIIAYEVKQ